MRVREWAGADYYAELGVAANATRDEIAAAYRARARVLHPDTGPTDPHAEAGFVRAATAYRVLTGPLREDYDRARRRGELGPPTVRAPAAAGGAARPVAVPPTPFRLTRRGARGALWGGIALLIGGLLAAVLVVNLQVRDASLRRRGVSVEARVVRSESGIALEFHTRAGALVRTGVPDLKSGTLGSGATVAVRYDPTHPARVVTERSTLARDITLWIVAAKLLIVGAILIVIGARRLSRPDRVPA